MSQSQQPKPEQSYADKLVEEHSRQASKEIDELMTKLCSENPSTEKALNLIGAAIEKTVTGQLTVVQEAISLMRRAGRPTKDCLNIHEFYLNSTAEILELMAKQLRDKIQFCRKYSTYLSSEEN